MGTFAVLGTYRLHLQFLRYFEIEYHGGYSLCVLHRMPVRALFKPEAIAPAVSGVHITLPRSHSISAVFPHLPPPPIHKVKPSKIALDISSKVWYNSDIVESRHSPIMELPRYALCVDEYFYQPNRALYGNY